MLGAEDVDRCEGDTEVERGEDEVHAQCVPAVVSDEVLETLGEARVRRDAGGGVVCSRVGSGSV